ncbi:L-threonylcarbamoyladenylate synthase [Chitinophaga costaii]|uniref:L-threonylcarbamoyladenylate synthase n=1 Tax=Chitinophaga costaii TaxID=1335309 RepID=A0A1C4ESI1_9BACT|nr:L-threonylcarbamoyladenylate synthase [Chitinophaga costaii]PUZ22566.1 Sua5/YciO/YrdC/YwlC family protein [Chitinophaga costaii]SCC46564.1 L-threonylcarbamoyladenylate synthase [Chitinophaga costaii]
MEIFDQDLIISLAVLRSGGNILYPTDTIWGLGCDATNEKAVRKIFELKQRPVHKSMVILMAEVRSILQYVAHPHPNLATILDDFDSPTTVIYEGALNLAPSVINEDGSVAIRLVKDQFCRHLIKRLRKPIVSTSANLSGEPAPVNFAAISPTVKAAATYIVRHRQYEKQPAMPSRIVKIRPDGSLEIIRE